MFTRRRCFESESNDDVYTAQDFPEGKSVQGSLWMVIRIAFNFEVTENEAFAIEVLPERIEELESGDLDEEGNLIIQSIGVCDNHHVLPLSRHLFEAVPLQK